MTKLLSEEAVARYRRDGYHFPIEVLSSAETRALRGKLEAYERSSGGPIAGDMRHKPHLYLTFLSDLIHHPRILDAVEDVLGPNLLVWSTSFFIKEPDNAGFVSWHQDATYWGLSSPDVMTVWVAFTPANLLNGCMMFMPGIAQRAARACRHVRQEQPAEPRPGDRGQGRREQGRRRRARARPGVAASRAAGARLGAQQVGRPAHRLRHPLHPDPCEAGGRRARQRHAGARRRYFPPLRARAAAHADCTPEAMAAHAAIVGRQVQVLYRGTGQEHFRP